MTAEQTEKKQFIGYEYKEMVVKREVESLVVDGYENFGWEVDALIYPTQPVSSAKIKFKRNRKIRNKAELTRLQRQFDAIVEEIQKLEGSKTVGAISVAFLIGLIGTGFVAGSVFAVTAGLIPLTIILAVPGFIGWIVPYFFYKRLKESKAKKISPVIDQKYDELYETTKQGNELLIG